MSWCYNAFLSFQNATALSRWNLILNNKLVEVVCRVLPPELIFSSNLFYNHEYRFSWLRNTSYLPMLRCVKVKHWIILTPFSFKSRVEKFLTNIQKAARSMSYLMPDPVMLSIVSLDGTCNESICVKIDWRIICISG